MRSLLVVAAIVGLCRGIAIDNGIIGDPEVQCGATMIQFSFQSENSFEALSQPEWTLGMVYAKNHHDNSECRQVGEGIQGGGIMMPFDTCNVRRFRSADPRGIFVRATIVVQFHPSVLTKIDRAFHLECFYMEADKTVDQELEVSMITTELRTFQVPMPTCRYEILGGESPDGLPVRFVRIGEKIYHKFTCDTETLNIFCMEVYSCTVDDAQNPVNVDSTIELINFDGCATDRNLLDNLEYPEDLIGGMASHVFKYADRPQLYFNCQIRIGVKEPNSECITYREQTGGQCDAAPETFGRKKRSAERLESGLFIDVAPSSPIYVADVDLSDYEIPEALRHPQQPRDNATPAAPATPQFCLTQGSAGLLLGVVGMAGIATIALTVVLINRFLRTSKH